MGPRLLDPKTRNPKELTRTRTKINQNSNFTKISRNYHSMFNYAKIITFNTIYTSLKKLVKNHKFQIATNLQRFFVAKRQFFCSEIGISHDPCCWSKNSNPPLIDTFFFSYPQKNNRLGILSSSLRLRNLNPHFSLVK